MSYSYEIQILESQMRNNNEKIQRLEMSLHQLKQQREELKTVDKNKLKITSMLWRKKTTNIPKEITTRVYDCKKDNVNHIANMRTAINNEISNLKSKNRSYQQDIQYYKNKELEDEE